FREDGRMFYILTNSRAMDAAATREAHADIAHNVLKAARETGKAFTLVSRSDSTLRGHFPLETHTLRETLEAAGEAPFDGEIICPFFPEGGRFTMGDVHYVREGDRLVPAGMTEFARDRTFGYASSHLGAWVEEKTGGLFTRENTIYISLETLREGGPDAVAAQLGQVSGFRKAVVNAVTYGDLRAFAAGCLLAMARGKRFLFRTAAALPKVLGGVPDRPLLGRGDFGGRGEGGGLVVVGSHVGRTTRQVECLLGRRPELRAVEFRVARALDPGELEDEIVRVATLAGEALKAGGALLYTSREYLDVPGGPEEKLRFSARVSRAVTEAVARLAVRPAFIIAKGGITSSDVGVHALRVRKALVLGQVHPGVPVWRTGVESRFPGMPYVIFPGNVGQDDTLAEVYAKLA
ncbi:MAG TPA: four-carbon acid sugar kinase family protein, partial [Candidatus Limnocylindria bacterium]|nr:four-carbon acid sugar kinase family protein [Candidatus Limnocylindria bacterium]